MTKDEMVELLKNDVEGWNKWKSKIERGPGESIKINLREADLCNFGLSGADFSWVNLDGANLSNAVVSGAKFIEASLIETNLTKVTAHATIYWGSNLSKACLFEAELKDSDFAFADLSEARLKKASMVQSNLFNTNLSFADLSGADLSIALLTGTVLDKALLNGAKVIRSVLNGTKLDQANCERMLFAQTSICNVDLRRAKGLNTCLHAIHSSIGTDTLRKSRGNIPLEFLRGCGLQDWEIEHAKLYREDLSENQITEINYKIIELRGAKPLRFFSTFISHSTTDKEFANKLYEDLQNKGIRCWYAPEDMKGGKKLHEQIFTAINLHEKLLLILSEASMKSEWVITEIRRTRKEEKKTGERKLFPISLVPFEEVRKWECFDAETGKDLAIEIREYFIPDFTNWETDKEKYQKAFDRMVRDLRAE